PARVRNELGAGRAELGPRLQRPPRVVRLILRARRDLDVRRRPRPADRVALRVPPIEHDRACRLSARPRRRQRPLAPLLASHELRTAGIEPLALRCQPIVEQQEPKLLVGQQERLAAKVAVRHNAQLLNPLSDDIAERRELALVLRPPPRHPAPPPAASEPQPGAAWRSSPPPPASANADRACPSASTPNCPSA